MTLQLLGNARLFPVAAFSAHGGLAQDRRP